MLNTGRNDHFALNVSRPLHQVNQPHQPQPETNGCPTTASFGHNEEVPTPYTYPVPPSVYAPPFYPLDGCFWNPSMISVPLVSPMSKEMYALLTTMPSRFPSQQWPLAMVGNPVTTTDAVSGEQVVWAIPEKRSKRIPIINPLTNEEVVYQPPAPAAVKEASPPPEVAESCPKASSGRTRAWTTSEAELICIPVEVRRRSSSESAAASGFSELVEVERDSAVELNENFSQVRSDSLPRDSGCSVNGNDPGILTQEECVAAGVSIKPTADSSKTAELKAACQSNSVKIDAPKPASDDEQAHPVAGPSAESSPKAVKTTKRRKNKKKSGRKNKRH
ncbi:hypothetical protein HDU96_006007 [Phlyctochytrium bullatum]|nr:hypothetical protein HDU96_006007 [Phlyctochytrium bullatum]